MGEPLRVLIVEDCEDDAELIARLLRQGGYELTWQRVDTAKGMATALAGPTWDAIICDYRLPGFSGLAALKTLQKMGLDLPFIMVSGQAGEETAVEAMRAGAHDYLIKDRLTRLLPALEREMREAGVRAKRRNAEWALRRQERFLRQIIDANPTYIYSRDRIGRFTMANKAMADLFDVDIEDLVGTHLADLSKDMGFVERSLAEDREVLDSGRAKATAEQLVSVPPGNTPRWHQTIKLPIVPPDSKDVQVLGVSIDITERKLAEQQLQHDALHDNLTGLPNRVLFMERLEFALAHHRRCREYEFAVLVIDLNRLRMVNDSMGHPVGDELLVLLAQRLHESTRTNDTASRIGGDEFAVLLDGIDDAAAAVRAAERIQEHLSRPATLAGEEVFPSVSIGIALGSTGYDQPDHLLRDASTAMYRAKSGSKPHELFDRRMHEQVVTQLRMESDLRRSLTAGDFLLHYQPVISLQDNRVVGFEALIRWLHADRGLMPPGSFIPAAEETGLIVPLCQWTLQTACAQVAQWNRELTLPHPLWVSVNLSPRQFGQRDLVEQVDHILQQSGADSHWLKLEITEATAMEKSDQTNETLSRLRDRGIHMLVDDFGTGYSSLSRLQRFPFDTLKIDQSFVQDIDERGRNAGFIRTIVLLAHGLGMTVTAEGVETQRQKALLEDLGCEFAQGFLFSHPLDARDAARLLSSYAL